MLARLVQRFGDLEGRPMGAAEAVRLAGQLARTLDQLVAEEVPASRLAEAVPENVAAHWQQTLKFLRIVTEQWQEVLNGQGQTDAVARRNLMFECLARRWLDAPPPGFVIARYEASSVGEEWVSRCSFRGEQVTTKKKRRMR